MGSAILHGRITDDGGLPCEGRFQWGYSAGALVNDTAWQNTLATGDTFQELITGLPAGTRIYFRAQARNASGTTSGLVLTFITLSAPPIVSTTGITALGTGEATLHGVIEEDMGAGCAVAFDYGGTSAYGSETIWVSGYVTGDTFEIPVLGLSPGNTFHYRAKARNKYGTGYGQDLSFTTFSGEGARSGVPMELLLILKGDL